MFETEHPGETMPKLIRSSMLATLLLAAPVVQAAPAMWEVSDGDSTIHLFGSVHILPEGTQWRTPLFDELLGQADTVVFETDLGPQAQAEIGVAGIVKGVFTDGTLLTDLISPQTENLLRRSAEAVGAPMGTLLAMRPWMAATTIEALAAQQAGLIGDGVELSLYPELDPAQLRFLESGEEQLDVLAGGVLEEQLAYLETTLDRLGETTKMADKLVGHWLGGTPERLAPIFEFDMGGYEDALLDRLLYARNRSWIEPLEAMLADNEQAMVIVGAAHLLGPDNVVQLLTEAGYTVERIQ
jgi:uncharacterized protein YbaP (TraB family)